LVYFTHVKVVKQTILQRDRHSTSLTTEGQEKDRRLLFAG